MSDLVGARRWLPAALGLLVLVCVWGNAALADSQEKPIRLVIRLPENAQLYIDGRPTRLTGPERVFESPAVLVGKTYHYAIKGVWKTRDGQEVVREVARFAVKPGQDNHLDLLTVKDRDQAPVVGHTPSADAMMLRRENPQADWEVVRQSGSLHAGDLVLGLSGAEMLSPNKAVQLTLLSDLSGKSPYPIRESAVRFPAQPGPPWDLEFVLDRGRVDVINKKAQGAAKVKVIVHGEPWELSLEEPGSRMALELFGRWPKGATFNPNPGPGDVPQANMVLLALHGEIQVSHGGTQVQMLAPPGPALLRWDNVTGADRSPQKLDKLPEWAHGDQPGEYVDKVNAIRKEFRTAIQTKPIGTVLDEFVNSDDPAKRRFAVFAMGALDDLPRLGAALHNARYPDVWDNGVHALRHWIGREPGQDMILYRRLIDRSKMSPVQAETVVTLLHSFGEDDLARPETYELLIHYLGHDELAIRGLASWHLKRLVPEGDAFGYDPLAPKDQRDQAIAKWKKLIPTGQLPPNLRPKKDK
jgi:uncharacterized protein (TIGR03000 family)